MIVILRNMKSRLVGNIHLIVGSAVVVPHVLQLLRGEGIEVKANPDIYVRVYQRFGIDDARELRDRSNMRAIGNSRRVFIIATTGLTSEAQNALLKTLEEPPADALFFIIVPAPEMLLSTLRSRAQVLDIRMSDIHSMDVGHPYIDADTFLAAPAAKRLEMLSPLLEKDEDDKHDIGPILAFLSTLERRIAGVAPGSSKRDALEAVYRARKYANDKGALVKKLLEQLALLAPKI